MHDMKLNGGTGAWSGRRRAVVGLAVGALALVAVAGTATAGQTHTAAPAARPAAPVRAAAAAAPVRSGVPGSAVDRVADFYGAYIDAVSGDTGTLSTQLRTAYLTPALQKRLTAWEAQEHADGVLEAQSIPYSWSVAYDGSGMGHTFSTVTLTWDGGSHPEVTTLMISSDTATHQIADIKPGQ